MGERDGDGKGEGEDFRRGTREGLNFWNSGGICWNGGLLEESADIWEGRYESSEATQFPTKDDLNREGAPGTICAEHVMQHEEEETEGGLLITQNVYAACMTRKFGFIPRSVYVSGSAYDVEL